ncbi:2-C-methyl-D-erythritol 2,4-cyclodiphosphate synthase [SAR202 cluster bacterium AC-409-J13_OGT_754m]|nr:2-C-methyl-D-erythritol 2,4-cyclodiphosphate synthase [SAR202 cluster bacterium AC-409-J13_OGT_754m]
MTTRIGIGFDAHAFQYGGTLTLGGVSIPYEKSLIGHSDGDVVIHSIIDALLGASNLGTKGQHFPSSNTKLKGISSLIMLQNIGGLLLNAGWKVVNLDATILAQRPQLEQFFNLMANKISLTLNIQELSVSIKATTTDHMGFIGREEGIATYAVALIESKP